MLWSNWPKPLQSLKKDKVKRLYLSKKKMIIVRLRREIAEYVNIYHTIVRLL